MLPTHGLPACPRFGASEPNRLPNLAWRAHTAVRANKPRVKSRDDQFVGFKRCCPACGVEITVSTASLVGSNRVVAYLAGSPKPLCDSSQTPSKKDRRRAHPSKGHPDRTQCPPDHGDRLKLNGLIKPRAVAAHPQCVSSAGYHAVHMDVLHVGVPPTHGGSFPTLRRPHLAHLLHRRGFQTSPLPQSARWVT